MTLGRATAMDLDTRITGAPLPSSIARTSENLMEAIIILSGSGPGPGQDIHIMMITSDPSRSQGITLPDGDKRQDKHTHISHRSQGFCSSCYSRDLPRRESHRSAHFHVDHHSGQKCSFREITPSRVVPSPPAISGSPFTPQVLLTP